MHFTFAGALKSIELLQVFNKHYCYITLKSLSIKFDVSYCIGGKADERIVIYINIKITSYNYIITRNHTGRGETIVFEWFYLEVCTND